MVRIDRRSGKKVFGGWPDDNDPKSAIIWEAFKPESEPRRLATKQELAAAQEPKVRARAVRNDSDFLQQQGGIY
jgi:penicillin-binding protein 1A